MNADSSVKYQNIKIVGQVSVKKVEEREVYWDESNVFLILGPTGAGKSTFIEALALKGSLVISSNQLEGCTQSISAYQVNNVFCENEPVYLVDIPGFADTKISELSIVKMLEDWMKRNDADDFGRILYLTPINGVRMPASQRQVLKTFQAITGINTAENITIVSTMWDLVWGDSATKRTEQNFHQFRDDIWKDYIDKGSQIVKFLNTQESALSILDNAFGRFNRAQYHLENVLTQSSSLQQASFAVDLYENLLTRIQNLQIQRANIQLELESADEELTAILGPQREEVDITLAKFVQELHEFGPAPVLRSFEMLDPTKVSSITPTCFPNAHLTGLSLLQEPDLPTYPLQSHHTNHSTSQQVAAVADTLNAGPERNPTTTSQMVPDADAVTADAQPPPLDSMPPRRGVFSQVMHSMKCWGQDVNERYAH